MRLPVDEILVFGPVGLVAAVYLFRQARLALKYRKTL